MTEIDPFVGEGQIDLEEAIAAVSNGKGKLPLKVSTFVKETGWPEWRVRDAIHKGCLTVDDSVRPMLITGGEMPITVREWHLALKPATQRIKPSVMSWSGDQRTLSVLGSDGQIRHWRMPLLKHVADVQRKEIDALPCARIEGSAS
jgi:hypothetical protein